MRPKRVRVREEGMADSNQAKRAESDLFNDDDPFAELTRIMGHDPRAEETNSQSEDLSIDLEKELMGEFDLSEFEAHEQAPQGHAPDQDLSEPDNGERYGIESDQAVPVANIHEAQAAASEQWDGDAPEHIDLAGGSADGDHDSSVPADAADDFDAVFHADLANELTTAELGSNELADHDSGAAFPEREQPNVAEDGDQSAEPGGFITTPQSDLPGEDWQLEVLQKSEAPDMAEVDMDFTTVQPEDATSITRPAPEPSLEDELMALLADDSGSYGDGELADEGVDPSASTSDVARPAATVPVFQPELATKPHPTVMSAPRQLAWAEKAAEPRPHEAAPTDQSAQESQQSYDMASFTIAEGAREPSLRSAGVANQTDASADGDWQPNSRDYLAVEPQQPDFDQADSDQVFEDDAVALQESFGAINTPQPSPAYGAFVPDIETVEVMEPARSVEQEFDVPELPPEENVPQSYADLEDIEGDLASAFENFDPGMADEFDPAPVDQPVGQQDGQSGQWEQTAEAQAGFSASSFSDPQQDGQYYHHDLVHGDDYANHVQDGYESVEDDYQETAQPPLVSGRRRRKRGYLVAGLVAGVAVFGAAGVYGTTMLGGGEDGPVLIGANSDPVKVQPEERGGTVVPNQDSEAYQRVAGEGGESAPRQEQLITTAEEPVDLAAGDLEMAPRLAPGISDEEVAAGAETGGFGLEDVKSQERLEAAENLATAQESDDSLVLAPRRVRTMVVRPDGSIVPREEPSTENSASDAAEGTSGEQEVAASAQTSDLDDLLPQSVPPLEGEDASAGEAMNQAAQEETPAQVTETPMPAERATGQAPAPAQSDSETAEPQQVASAANAASSASSQATSEWSMQIASQPSAESAQATYQDLARQYGNLLEGRGVNIVRAEIDGRGTFYRVRIPANTRDEAVQLCTQYQSAGGSCFVSR